MTTPTIAPRPVPLPFPDPSDKGMQFFNRYGVDLTTLGIEEDTALLMLGHVPPMRAVAAASLHARREWGERNIEDSWGSTFADALAHVRWMWAVSVGMCEDSGDCGYEEDGYCERCQTVADGGWWLDYVDGPGQHPNARPVTIYDLRGRL